MCDPPEPGLHPGHRSLRVKGHDYASGGFYFITICTHEKKSILGKIENATVELSRSGSLTRECWVQIPYHFPCEPALFRCYAESSAWHYSNNSQGRRSISDITLPHVDKGSLGAVLRSFKAIVTKRASAELHFEGEFWQRNYYEHLLRNEKEFLGASRYIQENPKMWTLDDENPQKQSV